MHEILHPGAGDPAAEGFPHAPEGWSKQEAEALAEKEGLALTDEHWEVVRVLQGCYTDEKTPRIRLLHDALEARFSEVGGIKHLYEIFPGGPIAQGCRLAGLTPPPDSVDPGFGSVL